MKKLFEVLVKPSRLILIIAGFAYAGLYAIVRFASIGGGFLPVLADLIIVTLTIGAVVAAPILLLLHKEEAAKLCFLLVAGYWLVSSTLNYLSYGDWAGEGSEGLPLVIGIFGFLAGLALAGVFVLLVLYFILKKEILKFAAVLTFAGAFLFIFVEFVLMFAYYCKLNHDYDNDIYRWTNFVGLFLNLAAPVGVCFGYLYFLGAPEYDFPKKGTKEVKIETTSEKDDASND